MKFKEWNEIAELVGVAAIVASLVFVGLQMKQTQDIARTEVYLGLYATGVEINHRLAEHVGIWIKGSRGETLDEKEAFVFANLMQSLNDQASWSSTMLRRLGDYDDASIEIFNLARILHENPGAKKSWLDWQAAYAPYRPLRHKPLESQSFSAQVREALKAMDELSISQDRGN